MDCWHHEIDKATTEGELVRCASDYLALWAPLELEPLALGLVEMRIESGADVESVKRWLTDNKSTAYSNPSHAAHLRELAGYFWHASARLGELSRNRMPLPLAPPYFKQQPRAA